MFKKIDFKDIAKAKERSINKNKQKITRKLLKAIKREKAFIEIEIPEQQIIKWLEDNNINMLFVHYNLYNDFGQYGKKLGLGFI